MATMYTIRIHAIPLSDGDGGRACTITPDSFENAVDLVNEIFEPADIRFAFDPTKDWHPRKDTSLNSLHNGGSEWWKEANTVAAGIRGEFTVFLRWGKDTDKPASNWFAYPPDTGQKQPDHAKLPTKNVDFIAITNQASRFGKTAGVVLAHEIGHYLGLFHTHPTWGAPDTDLVLSLVAAKGADGCNGDLLSDTPPDPGVTYYKEKVNADLCKGPASFKINGVTFTPDRSNVMSYFGSCQPPATITPQQIGVIRNTVHHASRRHLIDASAGIRYAGVFRAGSDAHALWVGDDWKGFHDKWEELSNNGLRLIDFETYTVDGKRRFSGVFRAGAGGHALWVGDDWKGFTDKWSELSDKGLRLINIESWKEGSARKYAGAFLQGNGGHALWVDDDWKGFHDKWEELSKKGLRLIDFDTWVDNSQRRYAGVFRQGDGGHALWVGDDWVGFSGKWEELSKQGLRLINLETWMDGSTRRYAGVFREGSDAHALWVNDDWFGFSKKWDELSKKGLRLIDLEVYGSKIG